MKPKNILRVFLLGLLLANFILSSPVTLAQSNASSSAYIGKGAEADIKRFLCAPTETPPSQQQIVKPLEANLTLGQGAANNAAANNPAQFDLYNCINRLYRFAIVLGSSIGVLFIVIAGYLYMSADGNKEAVDKAKGMLASTIASLVILFIGYILLRAINPDLIKFQQIQPESVKVSDPARQPNLNNVMVSLNAEGNVTSIQGGAGMGSSIEIKSNGCTFESSKQETESQYMTQTLLDKIKSICYNVDKKAFLGSPKISSVIGQDLHAKNSYHYKGCAIDFGDDVTSIRGKKIIQEALALGMRVNPGTDANQTYHIHVDLGTSCPSQ